MLAQAELNCRILEGDDAQRLEYEQALKTQMQLRKNRDRNFNPVVFLHDLERYLKRSDVDFRFLESSLSDLVPISDFKNLSAPVYGVLRKVSHQWLAVYQNKAVFPDALAVYLGVLVQGEENRAFRNSYEEFSFEDYALTEIEKRHFADAFSKFARQQPASALVVLNYLGEKVGELYQLRHSRRPDRLTFRRSFLRDNAELREMALTMTAALMKGIRSEPNYEARIIFLESLKQIINGPLYLLWRTNGTSEPVFSLQKLSQIVGPEFTASLNDYISLKVELEEASRI